MRAKSILTVLFLISLGVAAVLVYRAMPHRAPAKSQASEEQARTEVLAAAVPLKAATLLRAEDIVWRPISGPPKAGEIVRPAAVLRKTRPNVDEETRSQYYGAALRGPVAGGEPLLRSMIVKPGDRDFLRVVLKPGMRAIAIPVKTGGAGTGLLHPGDYVDVVLTQSFGHQALARRSVAETILQRLHVLAIDVAQGFGRTVTLEVTPEQAEEINVATTLGALSVTLRSAGGESASAAAPAKTDTRIKATWAGDVSPALGDTTPPERIVAQRPPVDIIRGSSSRAVPVKQ